MITSPADYSLFSFYWGSRLEISLCSSLSGSGVVLETGLGLVSASSLIDRVYLSLDMVCLGLGLGLDMVCLGLALNRAYLGLDMVCLGLFWS